MKECNVNPRVLSLDVSQNCDISLVYGVGRATIDKLESWRQLFSSANSTLPLHL